MKKAHERPAQTPAWMYVDGMEPVDIAEAHGIGVEDVLDDARDRLGLPDRLLCYTGLGTGGRTREDMRKASIIRNAA